MIAHIAGPDVDVIGRDQRGGRPWARPSLDAPVTYAKRRDT